MNRYSQIMSQLDRTEKLINELSVVYRRDLERKEISDTALIITHEVIEKCSNILDQTMTAVFEARIKPKLSEQPKRGGYFPAADGEDSYRSTLGQWKAKNLDEIDNDLDKKLRSLQPYSHPKNRIFSRIRELAARKHTGLEPQVRHEEARITAVGHGGNSTVRWNPSNVRFGRGVKIAGVPVDPRTQMPVSDPSISVKKEVWVSFHFSGGEDALRFCVNALKATKHAVDLLLGTKPNS